ncbi:large ribosomal subunit protein cL38 [Gastrolobium bilobum]|uniref:large ribosomal subunit protein cL38 n=1 Tax=Gastrolobium bilobum TaxID=150636 RepID=UPI002AB17B84|nr:large ribosomal subunit protein cL38 [Gastrolobium bilobum]
MSVSAIFGSPVAMVAPSLGKSSIGRRSEVGLGLGSGLVIECSSRPQKKATAHHMKTRPRKSQPWDINRKPTVYPPLPPLPPDWTLVISADESPVPVPTAASSSAAPSP